MLDAFNGAAHVNAELFLIGNFDIQNRVAKLCECYTIYQFHSLKTKHIEPKSVYSFFQDLNSYQQAGSLSKHPKYKHNLAIHNTEFVTLLQADKLNPWK